MRDWEFRFGHEATKGSCHAHRRSQPTDYRVTNATASADQAAERRRAGESSPRTAYSPVRLLSHAYAKRRSQVPDKNLLDEVVSIAPRPIYDLSGR